MFSVPVALKCHWPHLQELGLTVSITSTDYKTQPSDTIATSRNNRILRGLSYHIPGDASKLQHQVPHLLLLSSHPRRPSVPSVVTTTTLLCKPHSPPRLAQLTQAFPHLGYFILSLSFLSRTLPGCLHLNRHEHHNYKPAIFILECPRLYTPLFKSPT